MRCGLVHKQLSPPDPPPSSSQCDPNLPVSDNYLYHIDPKVITKSIDTPFEMSDAYSDVVSCRCKCVQHNVCSLKDNNDRILLIASYEINKVFCITLQETRTHSSGVFQADGFVFCKSASDNGCYGCEIWFSDHIPVGTFHDKKYCIKANDVSIITAEPRVLVVSNVCGCFSSVGFFCGYCCLIAYRYSPC